MQFVFSIYLKLFFLLRLVETDHPNLGGGIVPHA